MLDYIENYMLLEQPNIPKTGIYEELYVIKINQY